MVDLIKPSELAPAASVDTSAALVIDNGGVVLKATPRQVVDAGAPVPTEAEAIAGTDNIMRMTPLTTRQVLDNEVAPSVLRAQAWAESATAPDPLLPDSKSSKTWAQIATAAGEVVSITSGAGFPNRADFAVAISTGALDGLSDGQVVSAAGLQYIKKVGSTVIPDLNDWEPSGVWEPGHFSSLSAFVGKLDATVPDQLILPGNASIPSKVNVTSDGAIVAGAGAEKTKLTRAYNRGSLLDLDAVDNITVRDLSFDMGTGDEGGHAIRSTGHNTRVERVRILGIGTPSGGAGGTGALFAEPNGADSGTYLEGAWFSDSYIEGSLESYIDQAYAWIFGNVKYGFAHHLHSNKIQGTAGTGFAHELKGDTQWCNLHALIATNSHYGLSFGQQTTGINGVKFTSTFSLQAAHCDIGYNVNEGYGNLLVGLVHNPNGGPDRVTAKAATVLNGEAKYNVTLGAIEFGEMATAAGLRTINANNNFTQVAMFGLSTAAAVIHQSGSDRNVTEVLHPGDTSNSIRARINDTSGGNNPTYCHATGERFRTLSGFFLDVPVAPVSGVSYNSNHRHRFEHPSQVHLTGGTDGSSGNVFSVTHAVPGNATRGQIVHRLGAAEVNDTWEIHGWGNAVRWLFSATRFAIRQTEDILIDLGTATARWRDVYALRFRPGAGAVIWTSGAGTPEGSVTAPVGSLYTNTSGAAGTTLYVKESGTGNTGWVAK